MHWNEKVPCWAEMVDLFWHELQDKLRQRVTANQTNHKVALYRQPVLKRLNLIRSSSQMVVQLNHH